MCARECTPPVQTSRRYVFRREDLHSGSGGDRSINYLGPAFAKAIKSAGGHDLFLLSREQNHHNSASYWTPYVHWIIYIYIYARRMAIDSTRRCFYLRDKETYGGRCVWEWRTFRKELEIGDIFYEYIYIYTNIKAFQRRYYYYYCCWKSSCYYYWKSCRETLFCTSLFYIAS